ncbi:MAG: hypothetical protein A3G97_00590 [Candidatus Rokubacteria bacterium RIFCSPLOWO2_12_FULL_69_21]|nr:MAG: hypothetical protein A3G97_00590 [Candidatus Rokubacteria bacterium RIFCSPLOWO2_12_FULL_69_21]
MGGLPTRRTVNGFAVNPENPKVMFAAMRDGLFRSADAGESWKPVAKEIKNMAAVAVNPKQTDEVYAASEDGTLYVSTDGGTTWTERR